MEDFFFFLGEKGLVKKYELKSLYLFIVRITIIFWVKYISNIYDLH
jgi:hypothetical protein